MTDIVVFLSLLFVAVGFPILFSGGGTDVRMKIYYTGSVVCMFLIGVSFGVVKYVSSQKKLMSFLYGLAMAIFSLVVEYISMVACAILVGDGSIDTFSEQFGVFAKMLLPLSVILFIYFDLKKPISKSQKQ